MQSLCILSAQANLVLHGLGAPAALRSCTRTPNTTVSAEGWVDEEYRLVLEGSPNELDQLLLMLEDRLGRAAAGEASQLQLVPHHGSRPWASPLLGGQIRFVDDGSSSRGRGSQVLQLILRRADYWQAEQHEAPLSNAYGSGILGGLTLDNHSDGNGHSAYVTIEQGALVGDLPAPTRLELYNDRTLAPLRQAWLGCYQDCRQTPPDITLQAEGGAPLPGVSSSVISAASCSNGFFRRLTWTNSGEQALLSWALPPGLLQALNSRALLPLLRLATPCPNNDLWVSWRVLCGEQVLMRSELGLLQINSSLQPLPGLRLPPIELPGENAPAGLTLQLMVARLSGGARQLDLDFVALLPLNGWRSLRPLGDGDGLPPGAIWIDDANLNVQWSYAPALGELITHSVLGQPILVWPGHAQRIYLLHGGAQMDIGHQTRLRLFYYPRRRAL
ncbi:MAG: hypothetical protein LDL12_08270 [Anaerolinea sp.]|nr:hypothetical protein [Anaerolinea sp.]